MDVNDLPTDVEQLKALLLATRSTLLETRNSLLETRSSLTIQAQAAALAKRQQASAEQQRLLAQQTAVELSCTIAEQQAKLAAQEQQILELLKALRGKQRERIDPDQLLLFEIGELEKLIEEQFEAHKEAAQPRRKRKHGSRLLPDNLPTETIEYRLPEASRLCPLDGQPMQPIRWEESKQLDFVPAIMKVIIHRRAVYACPAKHDEAKLLTAPKPPQPIDKDWRRRACCRKSW